MTAKDLENYEPKGQLIGFPKKIIARMLECQEEQWNKIDVSVFEKDRTAGETPKGIIWLQTKEGFDFWNDVIRYKNFYVFFERYPKKEEIKVCSKCHKEKSLSGFHKKGNRLHSKCKECRKQEYQELKNNKKEDDSQEFRVGDEVIDIITRQRGKIFRIDTNDDSNLSMYVSFNEEEYYYTLDGRYYIGDKYPRLLHYRDDYDYDVIDFNNLPKRQNSKRWRANRHSGYWIIDNFFEVYEFEENNTDTDDAYNNLGNYFQTKEEAQEVADKLKKYFQELINLNK